MAAARDPLMARCVAGETAAWRELHKLYFPVVAKFLRRVGVAPGDLEDASQEVWTQVFRYLGRFEGRSDLKTWMYKICLSHASRLRRKARVAAALRFLLPVEEPIAPRAQWSEPEVQRRVHAALDAMKPAHREAFVLFELEGLSGEEAARVIGIPHATVRRRLHHARQEFEAIVRAREVA